MNLLDLKTKYYFFDPAKFCDVFVFIDFGNVRPWAKDFWPRKNKKRINSEIDIRKLAEVCDWVNPKKKFFYYGHFPENSKLGNNHKYNRMHKHSIFRIDKARKSGFITKTKEIKFIPGYSEDGKYLGKVPKCNFDVEITMDMLTKIQKYNTVMLFSGDSDFGGLLQYLKSKGKNIVVVCTRSRMSAELKEAADKYIPAESLKRFLQLEK